MATERTWVLFHHDTGYGDQLIDHINQAIRGKDMVAESSAPYDEMLSLADSKRAMAEVAALSQEVFANMTAQRDKALDRGTLGLFRRLP